MGATSTISSKGQITVPVDVRKRLGVKPGDKVEFVTEGEQTVMKPVRSEVNPFEKWVGTSKEKFGSDEAIDQWISDMRDDEDRLADLQEIRLENRR